MVLRLSFSSSVVASSFPLPPPLMDMTHSSRALTPFVRRTKVLRWPFKLVLFTSAPGLSLTQLVFAPTMCLHIYERLEARTCHLLLLSFATNPTYLAAPVLFSPLAQSTESNSDLYLPPPTGCYLDECWRVQYLYRPPRRSFSHQLNHLLPLDQTSTFALEFERT